jgi:hypothetical protein
MKRSWLVASTEQVVAARVQKNYNIHVRALDAAVRGVTNGCLLQVQCQTSAKVLGRIVKLLSVWNRYRGAQKCNSK